MSKKIVYDHNARKALEVGINILAQAVGVTLGPKGKNVVLENNSGIPQIVNDGITIAKEIELKKPIENLGVVLVRQAASKTNNLVGDGTTTTTILAQAIVKEGMKSIVAGSNPTCIKNGIDKAVKFIVNKIAEYSRPVMDLKDIIDIASISLGGNVGMGHTIANAIKQVGREGIISLEETQSTSTCMEINEGMSFNKGFMSSCFLSDSMQANISQNNTLVLLTDKKITSGQKELIPLLEKVALTGRALLIVADDIDKEALSTLIINKLKGVIDVVAVRIPGFGDRKKTFLEDVALLTNATVVSEDLGLSLDKISLDLLGSAKRIIVSKYTTTVISDSSHQALRLHCDHLRRQIELSCNSYEKEKLQERLAKLTGGVAVIKLGAATEIELKDKKLRSEDAIRAAKAAIEEGVVPGGGSTFVHLSYSLRLWANKYLVSDELLGAHIVARALLVPFCTIVKNTGHNPSLILEYLRNSSFEMGYDANRCESVDMYIAGIIDPAKVTRLTLQHASSIASMILDTECIISDKSVKMNL